MKEGKSIKAVVFDVGGVLQLPKFLVKLVQDTHLVGVPAHCGHRNKSVHEYLADKFKILIDQWFDAIDTIYAKSIEGKVSEEEVINIISRNLNVSKKKFKKFVIRAYKNNVYLNKVLLKKVKLLKKRGYKTAILSDQWHLSNSALIPKNLRKHFNPVIVSCEVGMRKPNPKIYKLLLKELNIKPNQILFIDNQEWNMRPAKKLGIKTILFKNNKQLFENKIWIDLFKQTV